VLASRQFGGGPMKPAPFEYVAAGSIGEAVEAISDGETQVLAGGQSLVLEMNYRNRRPARLVDINRVPGLDRYAVAEEALTVGPLVRHRSFAAGVDAGPLGRLLARVARHIAHPPIRARGTMLGSLAYAHPAAEWPAVVVLLDASLQLTGSSGAREVPAREFFTGPFGTARRADELLRSVALPLLPEGTGVGFEELRRTQASFAQLAALATLTVAENRISQARVALVNAGERPVRAVAAEAALLRRTPDDDAFADAAREAAERDADPRPQPHTDLAYQRHAISVLVRRALRQAAHTGG
jgi:carbon-monoxide dehydrogenase medium subunit